MSLQETYLAAMREEEQFTERVRSILPMLNERQRRLYLAVEARTSKHSISYISRISGVSRSTISAGIKELNENRGVPEIRDEVRRRGAGRKSIQSEFPELMEIMNALLKQSSQSVEDCLVWADTSLRKLQQQLNERDYYVSHSTVSKLLNAAGYMNYGQGQNAQSAAGQAEMAERFSLIRDVISGLGPQERILVIDIWEQALPAFSDLVAGQEAPGALSGGNIQLPDRQYYLFRQEHLPVLRSLIGAWWLTASAKEKKKPSKLYVMLEAVPGVDYSGIETKLAAGLKTEIRVCLCPAGLISWRHMSDQLTLAADERQTGRSGKKERRYISVSVIDRAEKPMQLTE